MEKLNGLPLFYFTIDMLADDFGISVMSLVESAAVEKNFIALSKNNKKIHLAIDDEKRIVTGVALRANFPIYRNENGEEYYFKITEDQIRLMMQRFMREKRLDSVNIDHNSNVCPDNVYLIESYQLTEGHRITNKEFSDIELGSWMVTYKIDNDDVWDLIKTGKINGFSVEMQGNLQYENSEQLSLLTMYQLL